MPKLHTLKYTDSEKKRLDIFLSENYPEISRSQIAKVIEKKLVKLNSKTVTKPAAKVHQEDKISFKEKTFKVPKPVKLKLQVIYSDPNILVINKPSGIITHAKGAFSAEGSVASFISSKLDNGLFDKGIINNRAGIVHRLDRGTSGVIVTVRNEAARKYVSSQFSKHKVKKIYYAVISGKLPKDEALINMPIERHPNRPATFRTGPKGKPAITQYQVIASNDRYTLVKLMPTTGRTHQLRVHLKAINHPIVGDITYGGEPAKRLMLHASSIELNIPKLGLKKFETPMPKQFSKYVRFSKKTLN